MISVGGHSPDAATATAAPPAAPTAGGTCGSPYDQQHQSHHIGHNHNLHLHDDMEEDQQEQQEQQQYGEQCAAAASNAAANSSHYHHHYPHHNNHKTTTTGRKGDPRMHRAVAARLADPSLTLFQALVMGGFDYTVDDYTDSSCMDSDHVTLAQRKNQLSRRLRLAKRHYITPSAAQGKAVAAVKSSSSSSSCAAVGHYNHTSTAASGVASVMNNTIATNSLTTLQGGGVASITAALAPDSSIQPQQPQNQGLAEMLRQQRESFRLLQQQQLQQQQQQQQQYPGTNTNAATTSIISTTAAAPPGTTPAAAASWCWDNELQDPSKDSTTTTSPTDCSPSNTAAALPPKIIQAKDHPDFHPIIVSRVGGIGSACISSENTNTTNPIMIRRHSHTGGTTTTNITNNTTAIVPGSDSSNSSNSSYHVAAPAPAPPLGDMTGTVSHRTMLVPPPPQQQSLNRSTSLSTTMAAAAAATEQALVAQAQQEQQQQAQAFLNSTAVNNVTKMHPSGLALHSISKTAHSLGMTLELFALALASADTQRLSEALFQQPPAPALAATSQGEDMAAAAASEESPAKSLIAPREKGDDYENDGNNSNPATTSGSSLLQLPLSPLRTVTTTMEDSPLTRQEELALQLHMHEAKTLYSKCMLLAGFSSEQAAQDNPMAVRFSLEAWEREGQRLQQLLKTQHEHHDQQQQQQQDQGHQQQQQEQQQQDPQDANNNNSTNQNDQQKQHGRRTNPSVSSSSRSNNAASVSTISLAKRKRVCSTDEGQCTYVPGLHIHRLEGKCGHKAIVHNPKDGPAHIDFVVGTKVECYHQLRPLQATTIVSEDLLCDEIGACTKDADSAGEHCDKPPSPTPTQNTTIWPSQFKCQDLSCSIACSKIKPMDEQILHATRTNKNGLQVDGFGNSLDGTTTDEMTMSDQQEHSTAAAVAATLANNYFNIPPRIFDLNELDLESGEWNWDLNENDVGGFLGLFKLGDTAPAAASTTSTTTEPPPPATAEPPPAKRQHSHVGGKRVKQLEILQVHLQQQQHEEEPSHKKKKKKKQKEID